MADNTTLNTGSGGDVIATDDIGGVKHQQVKVEWGVDGTATPVSAANPMPVVQTGTHAVNATLAAETTKVIGTVNVAAAQTLATVTTVGTVSAVTALGTVTPGTAATSLGKAEDAAHSSGDVGVMALTVRQDTAAALAGTDADYQPLITDASGRLHTAATLAAETTKVIGTVNVAAAQTLATVTTVSTVTNVATIGTSVTPGTSAAHLGKAEDAAHGDGDTGVMALAVRRDADTTLAGTTGDYAPLQVNAAGSLKVAITSGAGSGGTSIADGASFTRDSTSLTPVGGVVESSAPTVTAGDAVALSLTTGGAVRVDVSSGGIQGRAEDAAAAGGEDGIPILAVRRDSASSGVSADGDWANLSVTSDGSLRVSGSSGTTQYAEDAVAASGDSLCMMGAVRRDTAASSSGTDGDNSTINVDANGRLHVITGPSTGTIEVVGDVAHDAAAAGNPVLVAGYASAAAPTDVSADADAARIWTLRSGAVATQETYAGVLAVAGNGASGTGVQRVTLANDSTGVIATVASVTNVVAIGTSVTPGTSAAHLGKAEDAAHTSGDTGVMMLSVRQNTAAALSGTDADYQPLITDTNGRLHTIEQNSAAALTSVQLIDDPVFADDAAYTLSTSKVGVLGGIAVETDGTDPTTVSAEGDAAALRTDRQRLLLVNQTNPRSFFTAVDYSSAQTNASIQAAPGANLSLYITDIFISNGATAGKVTLLDGSGGTVKFVDYPGINGGVSMPALRSPIRLTANTALCITSTTVTTHSVSVGGYIAP